MNSIFIVDIETTGFDPIFDRVLEIGIVELNTITRLQMKEKEFSWINAKFVVAN